MLQKETHVWSEIRGGSKSLCFIGFAVVGFCRSVLTLSLRRLSGSVVLLGWNHLEIIWVMFGRTRFHECSTSSHSRLPCGFPFSMPVASPSFWFLQTDRPSGSTKAAECPPLPSVGEGNQGQPWLFLDLAFDILLQFLRSVFWRSFFAYCHDLSQQSLRTHVIWVCTDLRGPFLASLWHVSWSVLFFLFKRCSVLLTHSVVSNNH